MSENQTYMQALYEAAKDAAYGVRGEELKGISKEQFVDMVREVTTALDRFPNYSLHAALYAVTYLRNAFIQAITDNQARLEDVKETNS